MTIYERIKSLREKLNMTQEELAHKTGYKSRSAINKIEAGLRDINQSQIVDFAKALDVTPAYLMGWEDATDSDLDINTIAAHALEDLTEEEQEKVLEYAKLIKAARKNNGK